MKNFVLIVISIMIVWFVWGLVRFVLASALGIAFQLALLALFCYAVYRVYKALNREKIY